MPSKPITEVLQISILTGAFYKDYDQVKSAPHDPSTKDKAKWLWKCFRFLLLRFCGAAAAIAAFHIILMLIGCRVLRDSQSDEAYHTDLVNVARVGAVGGAIGYSILTPVILPIHTTRLGNTRIPVPTSVAIALAANVVQRALDVALVAAAGALGASILHSGASDGIDPLHAARMSAVGAAIVIAAIYALAIPIIIAFAFGWCLVVGTFRVAVVAVLWVLLVGQWMEIPSTEPSEPGLPRVGRHGGRNGVSDVEMGNSRCKGGLKYGAESAADAKGSSY